MYIYMYIYIYIYIYGTFKKFCLPAVVPAGQAQTLLAPFVDVQEELLLHLFYFRLHRVVAG